MEPYKEDKDFFGHDNTKKNKTKTCILCDLSFGKIRAYYRHISQTHCIGEKQYKCPKCSQIFKMFHALTHHTKIHHLNQPKKQTTLFVCHMCGSILRSPRELVDHHRTHSDVESIVCDICRRTFKTIKQIRYHMIHHYGFKKYKCELCEAEYKYASDFRRHLTKHGLVEKNFHCTFCDAKFYERKELRYHLKKAHDLCDGDGKNV